MSSVNKVIIVGHLGQKPEIKVLPSGSSVTNFTVATSDKFDGKDGKQERTEWHKIVVFGKIGENCAQYLDKGRQVYIEGRLQTRSWDDKNTGEKRYMTEIVAANVTFLGGGKQQSASPSRSSSGGYAGHDDQTEPPF